MADTKLTDLPELVNVALDDVFLVGDVSAGTSGSKKITLANVLANVPQVNFGSISVIDYGAVPDTQRVVDVVTTEGSATVTSATANFVSGDVGKEVFIAETGITYPVFQGTIASVTNATTVVLSGVCNSSRTAGNAVMYWGTDYATEIQAALDAAGALLDTREVGPNQPYGLGNARVIFPTTEAGSCYMFKTSLQVPPKVNISADALLFANVGVAGEQNREWAILLDRGANIENMTLACNYSQGVLGGGLTEQISSVILNLQIWGAGRDYDETLVGNEWQTAIRLQGFDWRLGFIWLKGGARGLWLDSASDVQLNNGILIGSSYPLICDDVYEASLAIRHDTPVIGSGSIDRCSKVKADLSEFTIINDGFAAGEGLKIGVGSAVDVNQELDLVYRVTRRGGDCVQVSNTRNFNLRLIAENNKPRHQTGPGVAIQNAVVYGSGIIEPCIVDAVLSSDIVPYTGTLVGEYRLNGRNLITFSDNLAGNGTTQGTATTLTKFLTVTPFVEATPALTDTAYKLPTGQPIGKEFLFFNGGSQNLLLFPPSGGNINFAGTNTALTVAPFNTVRLYKRYADDSWGTL